MCACTRRHPGARTHISTCMQAQYTSHHLSRAASSPAEISSPCLSHPINTEAASTQRVAAQLRGTVCTPILIGRMLEVPLSAARLALLPHLPPQLLEAASLLLWLKLRERSPQLRAASSAPRSCAGGSGAGGINSFLPPMKSSAQGVLF